MSDMARIKIAHLTSAHPRYDTRIFRKELASLSNSGLFNCHYVVADGKGDETINGISIFDVGTEQGRLSRMTKTVRRVFNRALDLDCQVYHLHDPELIPIGLKLLRKGKKVIFDAHEDLPKQILSKPYLNIFILKILSWTLNQYEVYATPKFSGIIAATPFISQKFKSLNQNTANINNYPIIGELNKSADWENRKREIAFIGGISEIRGIKQLVNALSITENIRLNLVGEFNDPSLRAELTQIPGWNCVQEYGFLGRKEVAEILGRSKAGVVTFHPLPNHIDAQPNKMFEYMSSGIPVIASNFPLWEEIIEGRNCGVCVDPLDPREVARGINAILDDDERAQEMGGHGIEAVRNKYNWDVEELKLLDFYKSLIPNLADPAEVKSSNASH